MFFKDIQQLKEDVKDLERLTKRVTSNENWFNRCIDLECKLDAIAEHLGIDLELAKCNCKKRGYVAKKKPTISEEF